MLQTLRRAVFEAESAVRTRQIAVLPPHIAYAHRCTPACPFVAIQDIYVCLVSWHVHFCTPPPLSSGLCQTCDRAIQTPDGVVCEISGTVYSTDAPLVADTFVSFGGQQQITQQPPPPHTENAETTETTEAVGDDGKIDIGLETHHGAPFSAAREHRLAAKSIAHQRRMATCTALLELLLFSDTRREVNAQMQKHTSVKTNSSVAKYLKTERVQYFEHVWRIMSSDDRETEWCRSMPEPDSPAAVEGRKACEGACIWWNRFEEIGALTQCQFRYHALAALYVYATGLTVAGVQIIRPHLALHKALPGVNKLNRFDRIVLSTYTTHEHAFRNNAWLWHSRR
jgi:hypothetical protein